MEREEHEEPGTSRNEKKKQGDHQPRQASEDVCGGGGGGGGYGPCAMFYGYSPNATTASMERFTNSFRPQTYNSGDPRGNWNKQRNLELASVHSYKPISSKFTISVNCQLPDAFMPGRMRITVLKLKPYIASMTQDTALPQALANYRNLALEPGDPNRNYLWKKYHTVLYDKTKIIRNSLDTEYRQFTFSYSHRYGPNEVVSPHMTSSPTGQEVYMNTPVANQIWVLVSWSDPLVATISKVRISRFDVWRDTLGHSDGKLTPFLGAHLAFLLRGPKRDANLQR
jgi:hypothetical protein